jgi:hypothetical protein
MKATPTNILAAIGPQSIDYLNEHFSEKAPEIAEFLVLYLMSQEEIEISLYDVDGEQGAFISYDPYAEDKQLSLKTPKAGIFELELFMYDDDDEELIYSYILTDEDVENIPPALLRHMEEVRLKKKERVVNCSSL